MASNARLTIYIRASPSADDICANNFASPVVVPVILSQRVLYVTIPHYHVRVALRFSDDNTSAGVKGLLLASQSRHKKMTDCSISSMVGRQRQHNARSLCLVCYWFLDTVGGVAQW